MTDTATPKKQGRNTVRYHVHDCSASYAVYKVELYYTLYCRMCAVPYIEPIYNILNMEHAVISLHGLCFSIIPLYFYKLGVCMAPLRCGNVQEVRVAVLYSIALH